MGVDISGVIEIYTIVSYGYPKEWAGIVHLEHLVERNYGMFGALFGVRNNDGFTPAFADRGLPEDISEETRYQVERTGGVQVRPSWALWKEVNALDWEQIGAQEETRGMLAETWQRERDNPRFVIESSTETPAGTGVRRFRKDHPELGVETITPEAEFRRCIFALGGAAPATIYVRTGHYSIREVISQGWQACFDVMRALAEHYGDDGVRLVVWFDSE